MYDLGGQFHVDITKLKAKSQAIIQGDKYRFTVLTERLIRLEYSESGNFNDLPTQLVTFRDFDIPNFDIKEDDQYLEITTSYFTLYYQKEMPFKSSKTLRVVLNNTDNVWYYGHPEVRNYFGSSVSIEVNNSSSENKGLYSLDGFVSFDDSKSLLIDQGGNAFNNVSNNIDIYLFMYNLDFGLCLQDYFKLTGYPSMIPRYALGNWWSKDRKYTSTEIQELVRQFDEYDVPISVMLLGRDWHNFNSDKSNTGYTFNTDLFPIPSDFIESMHLKGIRVGLNIDPSGGIPITEPKYSEALQYFPEYENKPILFNPNNPKFIDAYLKLLINPLEKIGVDFFWNDYFDKKRLDNLWIMNRVHYLDLEKNQGKRGMVLSRGALKASHRFPVLYSGETKVSWENFKELPFFNVTSANIGVSWWSHDVGGYSGGIEEDDLYIRSIQLGVFSPILRFHSKDGKFYKKEPWKWNYKVRSIACDYLRLRHRLIPYLYSEAYRYHKHGKVIFQPLYYLMPKLYDDIICRNEYFFGNELLIAPIINKKEPLMNRTIHRFFLPQGIWYDYTTGKKFPGNKKYVSFFKDEDYPVFAKQGSIIPLSNKSNVNNTSNPEELEIQIFPGKSNTFELYEDDGISSLYKEGFYLLTSIDYNYMPNNYTVIIRSLEGKRGIVPENRSYKIRFRNTKQADEVKTYFDQGLVIPNNSYVEGNDFIVEVNNVSSIGQLTINCKGQDIEIDAIRLINEDIDSILMDLLIETEMKEKIYEILFSSNTINKKRIALRKLKRQGLDKSFVNLFLKLLEYIEQI